MGTTSSVHQQRGPSGNESLLGSGLPWHMCSHLAKGTNYSLLPGLVGVQLEYCAWRWDSLVQVVTNWESGEQLWWCCSTAFYDLKGAHRGDAVRLRRRTADEQEADAADYSKRKSDWNIRRKMLTAAVVSTLLPRNCNFFFYFWRLPELQ